MQKLGFARLFFFMPKFACKFILAMKAECFFFILCQFSTKRRVQWMRKARKDSTGRAAIIR